MNYDVITYVLKRVAKGLTTPSNFDRMWYPYITNQISHIFLGFCLTCAACVIYHALFGEYPYKLHVFSVALCLYAAKELFADGWYGMDTIEDLVFFVGYGVGGCLIIFTEVSRGDHSPYVNTVGGMCVMIAAAIQLGWGVWRRIV